MRPVPHRTRGTAAAIVVATIALVVPGRAPAAAGQITLEVPNSSGAQTGFDVETGAPAPVTASSTDVRTNTSTTLGYRQLVAINEAAVAKLSTTDFASVGCAAMRGAPFAASVFTGADGMTDPVPGTIFVVRSRIDGYAKLRLVSIKTVAPRGLVLDYETAACPLDSTPPVITASVTGARGSAGWYTGPVAVAWSVADGESDVLATEGCDDARLVDDTTGVTLTCSAASAGGSAEHSVTVAIDATPPAIVYDGNRGVYELDEQVVIDCRAIDSTSGVAAHTCESVDRRAYEIGPGDHSLAADATDAAGNAGTGATSFRVVVTPDGLVRLILLLVSDDGTARALRERVERIYDAPNDESHRGAVTAFEHFVDARSGRSLDEATARLLVALVRSL